MMRWVAIALMGCGSVSNRPDAPVPVDAADAPAADDAAIPTDAAVPDDAATPTDAAPRSRWTLIQTTATQAAALPVAPLGSQHLIIVAVYTEGFEDIAITDSSGCNTYVSIPQAHAFCFDLPELQIFYARDSCPGASTIRVTPSEEAIAIAAWEVAGIRRDDPLGDADKLQDPPLAMGLRGPDITTSTDGEFVVSVAITDNTISGIRAGNAFTNDHQTLGSGWAHLTDPAAGARTYHAQWDPAPRESYCASAAAFQVAP